MPPLRRELPCNGGDELMPKSTLVLAALVAGVGCSSKDSKAADTAAAMPTPAVSAMKDSMPAMGAMPGMAMTGDADRDFLRMMSDHHKGMIEMAHMNKDRKGGGASVADAKKIDAKQDVELDQMVTMLEKTYKDPYAPKVMADNQAMADALKSKTGADYDRAFYEDVITHHGQAITMVDEYLAKAKSPAVKQMAEKIKADQAREIAEFQKKLDKMK